MAKRTLYFLRDSITGLYYTEADNRFYTWNDTTKVASIDPDDEYHVFKNAVVHTTLNSVKDGVKKRATMFRRDLKVTDEDARRFSWLGISRKIARERETLPSFGIEIVTVELSDGKA